MATIKSYTDLEQSKKLAEILPLESADMCYKCIEDDPYDIVCKSYSEWKEEYRGLLIRNDAKVIPCWSLAALLGVLPNGIVMNKDYQNGKYHFSSKYIGTYVTADNPIDACVAMVEKLHELKML